jgi:hypothetical protein
MTVSVEMLRRATESPQITSVYAGYQAAEILTL